MDIPLSSLTVRLVPSIALTGLIALLSLIPGTPEEGDSQLVFAVAAIPSAFQNTMHLLLYAVLAAVWSWTLERRHRRLMLAAALGISYGIALELGQLQVPGRYASVLDAALNTAGVALAVLVLALWRRRQAPRSAAGSPPGPWGQPP